MRVGVLPRLNALCLVAAVATAPLACAGEQHRRAGSSVPVSAPKGPQRTREQILNRDRALIGGLATSLALGLVGLGSLLANANFSAERDTAAPHEMPPMIAVAGGLMSLGFLTSIPLGIAVERHRNRYADVFQPKRGPRATASLSPKTLLRPAPLTP